MGIQLRLAAFDADGPIRFVAPVDQNNEVRPMYHHVDMTQQLRSLDCILESFLVGMPAIEIHGRGKAERLPLT